MTSPASPTLTQRLNTSPPVAYAARARANLVPDYLTGLNPSSARRSSARRPRAGAAGAGTGKTPL